MDVYANMYMYMYMSNGLGLFPPCWDHQLCMKSPRDTMYVLGTLCMPGDVAFNPVPFDKF